MVVVAVVVVVEEGTRLQAAGCRLQAARASQDSLLLYLVSEVSELGGAKMRTKPM